MSSYIYIEGGASGSSSKEMKIRCQKAFHKMLDRMGFSGRKPRLVACGARNNVYDRFCTKNSEGTGEFVAIWIDSEAPLDAIDRAWDHLRQRDGWEKPGQCSDEQVLFMTTCMESWIVSDCNTLRAHYGSALQESALPSLAGIELRDPQEVQEKLERATRHCKNAYRKGKRSFDVFSKLQPSELRAHLPSFVRCERILKDKLDR